MKNSSLSLNISLVFSTKFNAIIGTWYPKDNINVRCFKNTAATLNLRKEIDLYASLQTGTFDKI